jgi:hypothetical protein
VRRRAPVPLGRGGLRRHHLLPAGHHRPTVGPLEPAGAAAQLPAGRAHPATVPLLLRVGPGPLRGDPDRHQPARLVPLVRVHSDPDALRARREQLHGGSRLHHRPEYRAALRGRGAEALHHHPQLPRHSIGRNTG